MFRLTFGTLAGVLLSTALYGQTVNEYRIKAAFVYNFAKFVEWPAGGSKGASDLFTICVLGKNPFGEALAEVVNGKTIENRPLIVRQLAEVQEAAACRILFVSSSERKNFRSILSGLRTAGILTVGEADTFCSEGGIVTFKVEDGRVRIQINPDAAADAKLHISSKLLNLAQIVSR